MENISARPAEWTSARVNHFLHALLISLGPFHLTAASPRRRASSHDFHIPIQILPIPRSLELRLGLQHSATILIHEVVHTGLWGSGSNLIPVHSRARSLSRGF